MKQHIFLSLILNCRIFNNHHPNTVFCLAKHEVSQIYFYFCNIVSTKPVKKPKRHLARISMNNYNLFMVVLLLSNKFPIIHVHSKNVCNYKTPLVLTGITSNCSTNCFSAATLRLEGLIDSSFVVMYVLLCPLLL